MYMSARSCHQRGRCFVHVASRVCTRGLITKYVTLLTCLKTPVNQNVNAGLLSMCSTNTVALNYIMQVLVIVKEEMRCALYVEGRCLRNTHDAL